MLNQIAERDPTGIAQKARQAIRQKTLNAGFLRQIFLAARTSTQEALPLAVLSFSNAVQKLASGEKFRDQLLPTLLEGRTGAWEDLAPEPSMELRDWAATRFAPESRYLEVLNTQSWQHFLLALFAMPPAPEMSFLTAEQAGACRDAYEDLRAQNQFLPEALLTARPSHFEVRAAFRCLLGREPYKSDDLAEISRKGYPNLFRSLLRSLEFQRTFVAWLAGWALPHEKHKGRSPEESLTHLLPLLSAQEAPPLDPQTTWEEAFSLLWLTREYRTMLLSFLGKGNGLDGYVRGLIDDGVGHLQKDTTIALTAVVRDGGWLQCFMDCRGVPPAAPIALEVRHPDGTVVRRLDLEELNEGRQMQRLLIPHSLHSAIVAASVTCHLCLSETELDSVPLLVRPSIGDRNELVDKLNWRLEQTNYAEAASLLQNIQLFGDELTTLVLSTHLAHLTGDRDSLESDDVRALVSDEWRTFLSLAEERRLRGEVSAPLPDGVAEALGSKALFAPILDFMTGATAPAEAPVAVAMTSVSGTEPGARFLDAIEHLRRPAQVLELMAALSVIDAPDAFLTPVLKRLADLVPAPFKATKGSLAGQLAAGAILRASAYVEPAIAVTIGQGEPALKYAEARGRYSAAVAIAREIAKGTPSKSQSNQLALVATIINKYGNKDEATDLYRIVSDLNPGRMDLLARYLRNERALIMQDPLRWSPDYQRKVQSFRRSKVIALVRTPEDGPLREELAEALVIEGLESEAQDILLSLYREGELSESGKKRLVDLCVKNNANTLAIEICESLPSEDLSEWVIINHARALRALGRAEEAGTLLDKHASDDFRNVSREAIRNLFFLADFESACQRGEATCKDLPEDIELRLITAAAHLEMGHLDGASKHIDGASQLANADRFSEEIALFRYSIAKKRGDLDAIAELNGMFHAMGCCGVRAKPDTDAGFDDFEIGTPPPEDMKSTHPPVTEGPLVSVIMTSYNSSAYIDTAIRSILDQVYQNIELIVVDDCSSDDTPDKLRAWAARDPRIQTVLRTENSGTYVSKNLGLLHARGEYIALQDSDDWSHPERIGKSVAVLAARKDLMGITTDWLRMTSEGDLMVKAGGQISHVCCISLVFRRRPVLDKIGFFDSVRIEADMEYIRRIRLAFGGRSVARLRWPLLFGRVRSDSLTGNEEFGISRTGFSQPRLDYQAAQARWHHSVRQGASPFMSFPLRDRRFEAPGIILPERPTETAS